MLHLPSNLWLGKKKLFFFYYSILNMLVFFAFQWHHIPNYATNLCILVAAPIWHLLCTNFLQWCRKCFLLGLFETNLHYIWCKFIIKIKKVMPDVQPSKGILLGTNLVSNISTKVSKKQHIKCPISSFLVQIRAKSLHILVRHRKRRFFL